MLKAVIFDLGNTLLSSEKARETAREEQFEEMKRRGYEISREKYDEISSETSKIFDEKFWGDANRHKLGNFMEIFFDLWDREAPQEDIRQIDKAFIRAFVENMKPMPDAREVLDFCKSEDLSVGLITNGTEERTQELLSKFDLKDYFDIVLSSSEHGEKSTLEPFEVFLERTEYSPEECLMVGNRLDEDAHAKRVGMKTVWIKKGERSVGKEIEPDFVIEDLSELKEIIGDEIK